MNVRVDLGERLVRILVLYILLVLGPNGEDNSDNLQQSSRLEKPG